MLAGSVMAAPIRAKGSAGGASMAQKRNSGDEGNTRLFRGWTKGPKKGNKVSTLAHKETHARRDGPCVAS
jgi:hypothetical protein